MNKKFPVGLNRGTNLKPVLSVIILVPFLVGFFSSCSTTKCTLCDIDNQTIYHVELNEGKTTSQSKTGFVTYFPPIPLEAARKKVNLYLVDCDGKEPYRIPKGERLQQFVKDNLVIVDSLDIKRISRTSDADINPEVYTVQRLIDENALSLCERVRSPFKTELRAMIGFRSFSPTTYQAIPGDDPIEKKVLGFGPEGTMLAIGPEVAFLPSVATFNNKHRLNIGLMTGYWPVDGGNYIPLAIHPRFTFNDITNPLWGNCNAVYLFGDLGTAYDLSAPADKFWSNKLNSFFWDLGAGYDLKISKSADLSFDFGYRQATLALPSLIESSEWAECIENHGIPWSGYPRRRTGQFFIRIGITF
jgi:hypothetical protein